MDKDEIIRMAREAGAFRNYFDYGVEGFAFVDDETLERFAALVAAHVRTKDLTDDEIKAIVREASRGSAINRDGSTSHRIARAVIAADRELNK